MHKNHKDEAVIFYWKYIYLDFERAESFAQIFTQIDHRNCRNTVFQTTGSLLRFSHSSVYHCHIGDRRTESSWVQRGATCKEELIKYLQFGAANWRENTTPIFVKVWLIQNSQTVLGYAGRCFSWKLRTVHHYSSPFYVFRTFSCSFIYVKMKVYSKYSECDSWNLSSTVTKWYYYLAVA